MLAKNDETYMLEEEGTIPYLCDKLYSNFTINAVCYKPPKRCDEQVHRDNAVKKLN